MNISTCNIYVIKDCKIIICWKLLIVSSIRENELLAIILCILAHFGVSGRLGVAGVAGGERVPPAPLGWYLLE